jgi:hypothetical protein
MTPTDGSAPYLGTMTPDMPGRMISSPFIRWLLQNQEMLGTEGVWNRLAMLLQQVMEQGPRVSMAPAPMMASEFPGVSMEQAGAESFRDLVEQVQRVLSNRRRIDPSMLPPSIRDRVWPPEMRMIPPSSLMPGRPF